MESESTTQITKDQLLYLFINDVLNVGHYGIKRREISLLLLLVLGSVSSTFIVDLCL